MTTYSGWVGAGLTDEYYTFTLTQTTTVTLNLSTTSDSPAHVGLYTSSGGNLTDLNGYYVGSETGALRSPGSIVSTLGAGTYLIDVGANSTYGNGATYQLSASAVSPAVGSPSSILGGHVIGAPYALGTLTSATGLAVADAGTSSATNYYSFTLTSSELVTIDLSGVQGANNYVALSLIDSQGDMLSSAYARAYTNGLIQYDLAPGTYIVSASGNSAAGVGYHLALTATNLPTPAGGSTSGTAKAIAAPTAAATTVTDWVGFGDFAHYYTFTNATAETVTFKVQTQNDDPGVLYLDGSVLADAHSFSAGSATVTLSAGVHSLELSTSNYLSNYTGAVAQISYWTGSPAVGSSSDILGGAGLVNAYSFGALTGHSATVADWTGPSHSANFYSFTLSSASTVELQMDGLSNSMDAQLYLLYGNGNAVTSAYANPSNVIGDVVANLSPGTYYVEVRDLSSSTASGFNLTATAIAQPSSGGTTFSTAQQINLGALSAAQAIAEFQAATLPTQSIVADASSVVQADLDNLQAVAVSGKLSAITFTDNITPSLSVTAAQSTADAAALNDITSQFNLTIASSGNISVAGVAGHASVVTFAGTASQYSVTPTGDGTSFTISGGGTSAHMSNITALQFSDMTDFIASAKPVTAGAVSSSQVTSLYSAVFARTPDAPGLAFYEKFAAANPSVSLFTFAEFFLSSSEYTGNSAHNYAQSSAGDAQFITDSYNNLLHRAPAASDITFYQNNVINPMLAGLTAGTTAYANAELLAHATVLSYFSQSPEFLGDVQITAAHPADAQHWLILI